MSDLTFIEKTKLEKLFAMGGGYVLDFSDRTFAEFVVESTGKEIYDAKYEYASRLEGQSPTSFLEGGTELPCWEADL